MTVQLEARSFGAALTDQQIQNAATRCCWTGPSGSIRHALLALTALCAPSTAAQPARACCWCHDVLMHA